MTFREPGHLHPAARESSICWQLIEIKQDISAVAVQVPQLRRLLTVLKGITLLLNRPVKEVYNLMSDLLRYVKQ